MKVTLYAQPKDLFPYLKRSKLAEREFEVTDSLWGTLSFTDVGEEAWKSVRNIDHTAQIRLMRAPTFGDAPWVVLIVSEKIKVVLTCEPYMSGKVASSRYIHLRVEGAEKVVSRFVRKVGRGLGKRPWSMTDMDAFMEATGVSKKELKGPWEDFAVKVKDFEKAQKKVELAETVVVDQVLEHSGADLVLKVEIDNQRSENLKGLRVDVVLEGAGTDFDPMGGLTQSVPRLNSRAQFKAIFKFRPLKVPAKGMAKAVVRYIAVDEKKGSEKKLKRTLEPLELILETPKVGPKTITPNELRGLVRNFKVREESTQMLPVQPADNFDSVMTSLRKLGLYMLDPEVEHRGGFYLGKVDMFGADGSGNQYALHLEVTGDKNGSRVRMTLMADKEGGLAGFRQFVLQEEGFSRMFGQLDGGVKGEGMQEK